MGYINDDDFPDIVVGWLGVGNKSDNGGAKGRGCVRTVEGGLPGAQRGFPHPSPPTPRPRSLERTPGRSACSSSATTGGADRAGEVPRPALAPHAHPQPGDRSRRAAAPRRQIGRARGRAIEAAPLQPLTCAAHRHNHPHAPSGDFDLSPTKLPNGGCTSAFGPHAIMILKSGISGTDKLDVYFVCSGAPGRRGAASAAETSVSTCFSSSIPSASLTRQPPPPQLPCQQQKT